MGGSELSGDRRSRRGAVHRIETIWDRDASGAGRVFYPDRELDGHLNYAAARTAD